jgi:hypothetical protein
MAADDFLIIWERIRSLAPALQVMVVGRVGWAELVDRASRSWPSLTVSFGLTCHCTFIQHPLELWSVM